VRRQQAKDKLAGQSLNSKSRPTCANTLRKANDHGAPITMRLFKSAANCNGMARPIHAGRPASRERRRHRNESQRLRCVEFLSLHQRPSSLFSARRTCRGISLEDAFCLLDNRIYLDFGFAVLVFHSSKPRNMQHFMTYIDLFALKDDSNLVVRHWIGR
jgi:hypothetical protein